MMDTIFHKRGRLFLVTTQRRRYAEQRHLYFGRRI